MKSITVRYALLLLAICALLQPAIASPSHLRLRQRQDRDNDTPQSTPAISEDATPTSGPSDSSVTPTIRADPSPTESSRPSEAASSAQRTAAAPTIDSTQVPLTTGFALPDGYRGLPLQPEITPAIGLAGAIMLITGIAYTLIGVRQQMVQVFFSTAYLASLSVTVLIEYIVKPEVSDAVQGAYFVAIVLTGLVFGGLSFIFKDMVEGMCCLLGGFCLAMWFLTLRAGGLIQSTGGKAGFIAAFSLAGFALSFSRYTRLYGSIGSIAFAGATITVLGIDCFSRAGYKEFWVYIWNLNDQAIFPLNTQTYPITQAIRVETAVVVLLAVFGVISQLKLWRVVREKREKREAGQRAIREEQAQVENAANQGHQQRIAQDQAQWEAVHGEKKNGVVFTESAISRNDSYYTSSLGKDDRRSRHTSGGSIEMQDIDRAVYSDNSYPMPSMENMNGRSVLTVNVSSDDDITPASPGLKVGSPMHDSMQPSTRTSLSDSSTAEEGDMPTHSNMRRSLTTSAPPPPVVLPLPIPMIQHQASQESLRSNMEPIEEANEDISSRRGSHRFSANAALKRISNISLKRSSHQQTESQEELIIPYVEDDCRSSVAATLDDLDNDRISLPAWSRPTSMISEAAETDFKADGGIEEVDISTAGPVGPDALEHQANESIEPAASPTVPTLKQIRAVSRASLTPSTDPGHPRNTRAPSRIGATAGTVTFADDVGSQSESSVAASPESDQHSAQEVTVDVPDKLSKTALLYRTNEWAKHASDADEVEPIDEELQEPDSPGVRVEHGFVEAAKPVDVEELQKTAATPPESTAASPTADDYKRHSKRNSTEAKRTSGSIQPSEQERSHMARTSSTNLNLLNQVTQPPAPPVTLSRNSSASRLASRGLRSSSTHLLQQTLHESPAEEGPDPNARFVAPVPANNLMAQRESMIRNKPSSMNFNSPSTPNLLGPSDSASMRNMTPVPTDADEIPLSERRELLRQQRRSSNPIRNTMTPSPIPGASPLIYDSHQPKRTVGIDYVDQADRMARWRTSQRQSASMQLPVIANDGRRQQMINDQRQKQAAQQQQEYAAATREMLYDDMMRRTDMQEVHRAAMRKMQAKANRNVT